MSRDRQHETAGSTGSTGAPRADGTAPGKRTLTQHLPVRKPADILSDAMTSGGDADTAVLELTAAQLDETADQLLKLGEYADKGGDEGRGRSDLADMGQQLLDATCDRVKDELEDLEKVIDRAHEVYTMGPLGLHALNGAVRRFDIFAGRAHLGLKTNKIVKVREVNERLHNRLGLPTTGAQAQFGDRQKQKADALLKTAILDHLKSAEKYAAYVRSVIPVRVIEMVKQPLNGVYRHMQEAYVLMQQLHATKEYKRAVVATTSEVYKLFQDVKKQEELAEDPSFQEGSELHNVVLRLLYISEHPWKE